MSDLISRQAVNKIIDKWLSNPFYELKDHIYEMTKKIHELPSIENKREWIPVSERLPEEDGQYLITVKYMHVDGYDDIYAEHGEWYDGRWDTFCFGHCGKVEGIIAWQPLPEPYKADMRGE